MMMMGALLLDVAGAWAKPRLAPEQATREARSRRWKVVIDMASSFRANGSSKRPVGDVASVNAGVQAWVAKYASCVRCNGVELSVS